MAKKDNKKEIEKFEVIVNELPELKSQVFETPESENDGLEQLRVERDKIIEQWEKLGILDGLEGNIDENTGKLFESETSHIINEPEEVPVINVPKKRTVADLNQSEFRVYQRTGFIPE